MPRCFHDLRQNPSHVFGVNKEDQCPVSTDARIAENPRTLGFEFGFGSMDIGHFEAQVMLSAERIFLEESGDRRRFAKRLDQLDLGVRSADEANPDTLRGKVECRSVGVRSKDRPVMFETFFD